MGDEKKLETENGGYDPELFVNQDLCQKYECGICLCIMKDPMDINCNESHNFCKDCITELSTNYDNTIPCPLCNQNIRLERIKVNKFVQRLMNDQLVVKACEHKCGLKHIKLGVYVKHLMGGCPNELIKCEYNCGLEIPKKNVAKHKSGCKNRILMEFNVSPLIKGHLSNIQIAKSIKTSLEQESYSNIVVLITNSHKKNWSYNFNGERNFKREIRCKGKMIRIRKMTSKMMNDDKFAMIKSDILQSFVKGFIIDGKKLKEIKETFQNIFGGRYLITKNMAVSCDVVGNLECQFKINDNQYSFIRVQ